MSSREAVRFPPSSPVAPSTPHRSFRLPTAPSARRQPARLPVQLHQHVHVQVPSFRHGGQDVQPLFGASPGPRPLASALSMQFSLQQHLGMAPQLTTRHSALGPVN
jgi:hypothetical protein